MEACIRGGTNCWLVEPPLVPTAYSWGWAQRLGKWSQKLPSQSEQKGKYSVKVNRVMQTYTGNTVILINEKLGFPHYMQE